KEVMSAIFCDAWFSAKTKNKIGKLPWPSVTLFLRIERHASLQPNKEITGLVRIVGFNLNHTKQRVHQLLLQCFIQLLERETSPRARLCFNEVGESSLFFILNWMEQLECAVKKIR